MKDAMWEKERGDPPVPALRCVRDWSSLVVALLFFCCAVSVVSCTRAEARRAPAMSESASSPAAFEHRDLGRVAECVREFLREHVKDPSIPRELTEASLQGPWGVDPEVRLPDGSTAARSWSLGQWTIRGNAQECEVFWEMMTSPRSTFEVELSLRLVSPAYRIVNWTARERLFDQDLRGP